MAGYRYRLTDKDKEDMGKRQRHISQSLLAMQLPGPTKAAAEAKKEMPALAQSKKTDLVEYNHNLMQKKTGNIIADANLRAIGSNPNAILGNATIRSLKHGGEQGVNNLKQGSKAGAVSMLDDANRAYQVEAAPYVAVAEALGKVPAGQAMEQRRRTTAGFNNLQRNIARETVQRQQAINNKYGQLNKGEQVVSDVLSNLIPMAPAVASGVVGNMIIPGMGSKAAMTVLGNYARGMGEVQALNEGATANQAKAYGLANAGLEVGTEMLTGGLVGLPGVVKAGKVVKNVSNPALRTALRVGGDLAGEAGEEMLAEVANPYLQRAIYNPEAENASWSDVGYAGLLGALSAGTMNAAVGGSAQLANLPGQIQAENAGLKQQSNPTVDMAVQAAMDTMKRGKQQDKAMAGQAQEQTMAAGGYQAMDPKLAEARAYVDRAAKRSGLRFTWVDGLEHGARGKYQDGMVYLDVNQLDDMGIVRKVVAHEVYHGMRNTAEFKDLQDIMLDWHRVSDPQLDVRQLLDRKIGEYGEHNVVLDDQAAFDELTAEFVEVALTDEATAQRIWMERPNLGKRIFQWIRTVMQRLGKGKISLMERRQMELLKQAEEYYRKGLQSMQYQQGAQQPQMGDDNKVYADGRQVQYSIGYTTDNKPVVMIEGDIFAGKPDNNNKNQIVRKYLSGLVTTQEGFFAKIAENGHEIYLGRDLPGEYVYSKSSQHLRPELKTAKMQAAQNLSELIGIADNRQWRGNTKNRHKDDARGGWYKYDVNFAIPQGNEYDVYSAKLVVRLGEDGKRYLYDIETIKKKSSKGSSFIPHEEVRHPIDDFSIDNSISEGQPLVNGQFTQEGNDGDMRYSIRDTHDKATQAFVRADRDLRGVFAGDNPKNWGQNAERYINKRIRHGQDLYLRADNGDMLTITANTAGKAKFRNKIKDKNGKYRDLTNKEYRLKLEMECYIDELAVTSVPDGWSADKNNKHKKRGMAEQGWQYRTAFYEKADGEYYEVRLSVALNGEIDNVDVNEVYNIGRFRQRENTALSGGSSTRLGGAHVIESNMTNNDNSSVSNNIVADDQRLGNSIFDQLTEEQRQKLDSMGKVQQGVDESNGDMRYSLDGSRSMTDMVEQYGAIPPGENPAGTNRDIQVPRQTSDFDRTRQYVRTAMEAAQVNDASTGMIQGELESDMQFGRFIYEPTGNQQQVGRANTLINQTGWQQQAKNFRSKYQSGESMTSNDIVLAERLVQEAQNAGDYKTAVDLIADLAVIGTEAGRSVQALSVLKRLSPEGKLMALQRAVDRINANLINTSKKGGNVQQIQQVQLPAGIAEEMLQARGPVRQAEVWDNAIQELANQVPATWIEKVNAWRYLAMLSNPRTHIRNLCSNAVMRGVIQPKRVAQAALEKVLIKDGGERYAAVKVPKEYKDFAAWDWEQHGRFMVAAGGGRYNDEISLIAQNKPIFNNKVLDRARQKNTALLDAEDMFFKKKEYISALASYLYANGLSSSVTQNKAGAASYAKGQVYAAQQAKKATFQEASKLAQTLNEIEHQGAIAKFTMGAVLPFKKTPINILKRGFEYSPAGLIRGLAQISRGVRLGKYTPAEAIDMLAAGMTGTGIAVLGYTLASWGWLSGSGDDEDRRKSRYDIQVGGTQNYAITFPDGSSYTIDWLAPSVMPLMMGVELYDTLHGEYGEVPLAYALGSIAKIGNPALEMSCMQGITDALQSYNSGTGEVVSDFMVSSARSYGGQFIPAVVGAAARTVDDTVRSSYAPKDSPVTKPVESFVRQQLNKVPMGSMYSEPSIDMWGNIRGRTGGNLAGRAFNQFLSPGTYSPNKKTALDERLDGLYRVTGNSDVYPKSVDGMIQETKQNPRVNLNGQEYTRMAMTQGKNAQRYIREFMSNRIYQRLDDEQRAKVIGELHSLAAYTARKEALKGRGYSYSLSSSEEALHSNVTPGVYYAVRENFGNKYDYKKAAVLTKACEQMGMSYDAYNQYKAQLETYKGDGRKEQQKRYLREELDKGNLDRQQYWYLRIMGIGNPSKADLNACPYKWIKELAAK